MPKPDLRADPQPDLQLQTYAAATPAPRHAAIAAARQGQSRAARVAS